MDLQNRSRADNRASWVAQFFERNLGVTLTLILAFVLFSLLVCFWGQSPLGTPLLPNQMAQSRTVAEFAFSYESKEQTQRLRERLARQVPPVYRINLDPYLDFEKCVHDLVKGLDELDLQIKAGIDSNEISLKLGRLVQDMGLKYGVSLSTEDCSVLLENVSPQTRVHLFQEGLMLLKQAFREGIFGVDQADQDHLSTGQVHILNLYGDLSSSKQAHFRSQEEVLRFLRINLFALDLTREVSLALFHILKAGVSKSLIYDADATEEQIRIRQEKVRPVVVQIERGYVLTRPGTRVTAEQYEQLQAYRKQFAQNSPLKFQYHLSLFEHFFLSCLLLICALIIAKTTANRVTKDNYRLALTMIVVAFNLVVMRLILQWAESMSSHPILVAVAPFLLPVSLSSLLITILLGARSAILTALMVSGFSSLMQNQSINSFLVALVTCLVTVILCGRVRVRVKVIRAAFFASLVTASCAFLLGLLHQSDLKILLIQAGACIVEGVLVGVAALGLLPLLEGLFLYTTEITLLELSDFNHPLLRRMQLEAPGTYHHSLMVANLAENAASVIQASTITCRVCALFHDVGKLIKPEYFIENQIKGVNPHLEQNPSMSVLVIKSHVKEGIDLAQKYNLPKVVRDVIEQHHGTRLITYFYDKALKTSTQDSTQGPSVDTSEQVAQSMYRYDGPKPQFKESMIIALADSIEAASRSLGKVTPQSIYELVETIIQEQIQDHQLSDCPLTFSQLYQIKHSFVHTLTNMFHNRIEYPKSKVLEL